LALAFIHRPPGWDIEEARERFENRERMDVPSASAAFGMYTASDSWAAGGGHLGIWGDGRWRYTGGVGLASLKLSIEGEAPQGGQALFDYRLDGWGLTQSLRYRLGSTDLMVGALYTFMQMEASFSGDALPGLDPSPRESLGSAGLTLVYDSPQHTFTPDRGLVVSAEGLATDTWLGGDREYWSGRARLLAYLDPIRSVVLGLRAESAGVGEGVPFWARPSVSLRGVASGRYAGDRAGTLEGEVRWDVSRRWSLVGFGGAGWKFSDTQVDDDLRWVGGGRRLPLPARARVRASRRPGLRLRRGWLRFLRDHGERLAGVLAHRIQEMRHCAYDYDSRNERALERGSCDPRHCPVDVRSAALAHEPRH